MLLVRDFTPTAVFQKFENLIDYLTDEYDFLYFSYDLEIDELNNELSEERYVYYCPMYIDKVERRKEKLNHIGIWDIPKKIEK